MYGGPDRPGCVGRDLRPRSALRRRFSIPPRARPPRLVARKPTAAMNAARRARQPSLDEGAAICLRLAATGDDPALEQLAELSGRVKAQGPWIVADVDGQLWAALPLAEGEPLVDPFRPTAELRALLSLRAQQLRATSTSSGDDATQRRRRFRSMWGPHRVASTESAR
jgi:hypothetical protein